ncbi:hypothetical protein BJF86_02035 [Serinicoccus sp. CNJ-927]|uniref:hypothetical protein n=1 Tax=Serinicoccus sp. CNJ-927 TaxID=1904970 RepID=UPI00095AE850|nr:hypothetical protein [Serinicoccus sp. CNJ-927]OLT41817.1 hypothetical protein BJF86_02035 [Serinicoccus sp. CNJ-927]
MMNKAGGVAVLEGELEATVGDIVDAFAESFPNWIRVVIWIGRLKYEGQPTDTNTRLNRVLSYTDGEVVAAYHTKMRTVSALYRRIDAPTEDVDWTQCRIVADRDGKHQIDLVTDEPRRDLEGAGSDPYWDQVHDYLELNRAEVGALVERLRSSGDLPGEKKKSGRGVLSYFRPGT